MQPGSPVIRITCPDGKLVPESGTSSPEDRPRLARSGTLAHREVVRHLATHDPLDDELHERRERRLR